MTIKQLIRMQNLMLKDEVCKLTDAERKEFDALCAIVDAEEGGEGNGKTQASHNPCLHCNA